MYLSRLQLYNFKNHSELALNYCDGINTITGANGIGKTNILDAVHYLANAKSYFNGIDSQLIQHNKEFFSIKGVFESDPATEILVQFETGKKTLKKNNKPYKRLIDHIGLIQTVFITPYDIELVLGSSEARRKFIDLTLCQIDKGYLHNLSIYKKTLDHRNALLKGIPGNFIDPDLLDSFDAKLIPAGNFIYHQRKLFVDTLMQFFTPVYNFLSQSDENPIVFYESQLNSEDFETVLHKSQRSDISAQRSTTGIHKDDLGFELGNYSLKKYGSQGQIKSFIIALKLAQYQFFQSLTPKNPILLLDDIFEKIDVDRAQRLISLISDSGYGQIIITDTHASRVDTHFKDLDSTSVHHQL
ncbi:MAG: DNA replication and repair protein RecF [Bacteroidetes bacterium]|nr:DNA replication and repair protein RecF [Bacteroidota bacterium]